MQTNRSWSIDDKRYNFQFGCEIGWEIKGGKLGTDDEESFVFGDHHRVLELAGRLVLARPVDAVGHAELRQGAAATGDGNRARRVAGALPQRAGGLGVQGAVIADDSDTASKRESMANTPR